MGEWELVNFIIHVLGYHSAVCFAEDFHCLLPGVAEYGDLVELVGNKLLLKAKPVM